MTVSAVPTTYGASPIKRARRTQRDIADLRAAIVRLLERSHPMTVRQVFYRLVSMGAIGKTEQEYKGTVCRLLSEMRRDGQIPFRWIADNTRWQRKPTTFGSLSQALHQTVRTYRRAVWDAQAVDVEIWLEKDALSGVLYEETATWDVPLMVTRGYPSLSFLHGAAEDIGLSRKPTYLYYFGDHDPSGIDIPRRIERDIRTFAPWSEIHFERVAVTPEQIVTLALPTRPTKATDSRSRDFEGESVEVDAIDPDTLRDLVRDRIIQHIDKDEYDRMRGIEREEQAALEELYRKWPATGGAA
jgi:hypothetical protein